MITHVVVFWTNQPYEDSAAALYERAKKLQSIPGVENFRCGCPVPSPRGSVDDSFQVALSMDFKDQATADAYQSHPDHVDFVENGFKKFASRVVIYDFETVAPL